MLEHVGPWKDFTQKHTTTTLIVVNYKDYTIVARERSIFIHSYHVLLSEVCIPVLQMGKYVIW